MTVLPCRSITRLSKSTTASGSLPKLWGLGRETVRRLVKDDPGVIKIRMGRKTAHTVYSVPESAAQRIHTRLLNVA